MSNNITMQDKRTVSEPIPRARFEIWKYGGFITLIWGVSMIPSLLGAYFYYIYVFQYYLDPIVQFWPVFQDWTNAAIVCLTGIVLIGLYFLRLLVVILFTKWSYAYCNSRSPRKELIGAKGIGKKEAKDINYYHLRGTILRIFKWIISKSAFPWLLPWAFNVVGSNNLGKGTVMEDQFFCQEYLETGKNVYIGQGTQVSSHLVEGKYGAITLKKVTLGEHTVLNTYNLVAPGCYLEPYTELLPMSAIIKFQKIRGFAKYYGLPIYRISTRRYMRMLNIPESKKSHIYKIKKLKKKFRTQKKNTEQEKIVNLRFETENEENDGDNN